MAGPGDHAADRADTRAQQAAVVHEALVTQRIEFINRDDVRRQPGQIGVGRESRPASGVESVLTIRVVYRTEQCEQVAAEEIIVVLLQRGQVVGLLKPAVRDERAQRINPGDLAQPTLPLGLVRHR